MSQRKSILILSLLLIIAAVITGAAELKWKPLTFDNPGTKRLLKSNHGNYYFYRPLPEKSMIINVKDLTVIEIRAISKAAVSKPNFVLKYNNKSITYDLKLLSASADYQVYEPVRITLPPAVSKLELISYKNTIYYRAFKPLPVKQPKTPALQIISKAGDYKLTKENKQSGYYAFNSSIPLVFQVNKGKTLSLFIRAQLTEKVIPVFGLYQDGKFIRTVALSLKRTNTYKAEGITHLTIGKRIDFPMQDKIVRYELRPVTNHLFIARPVITITK